MRLIDADRLNEVIERNFCYPGCLKQIVDAQPTAYGVDKVVEQLKSADMRIFEDYSNGYPMEENFLMLSDAIKIVKAGIGE